MGPAQVALGQPRAGKLGQLGPGEELWAGQVPGAKGLMSPLLTLGFHFVRSEAAFKVDTWWGQWEGRCAGGQRWWHLGQNGP